MAELVEKLRTLDVKEESNEVGREFDEHEISFDHVDVETPDGLLLVKDLSFRLTRNDALLITGPSGCGKSSILRLMHGLWPLKDGKGKIVRPSHHNLSFLPQEPYLCVGTLADQITYPQTVEQGLISELTTEQVTKWLEMVKLDYLTTRFSCFEVLDWSTILSPGERQKIGFVRLLYQEPAFAVLDESTSAMSIEDENDLYDLVRRRGISIVSIGHRPSLRAFHSKHLEVRKNEWILT